MILINYYTNLICKQVKVTNNLLIKYHNKCMDNKLQKNN